MSENDQFVMANSAEETMEQQKIKAQIEEILEQIPQEQADYFRRYFRNVPDAVMRTVAIEKRLPDKILLEEHDTADRSISSCPARSVRWTTG